MEIVPVQLVFLKEFHGCSERVLILLTVIILPSSYRQVSQCICGTSLSPKCFTVHIQLLLRKFRSLTAEIKVVDKLKNANDFDLIYS